MLYRMRNQRLWLERRLSSEDARKMSDYLHLEQPNGAFEVRHLILYVGFPWRYMALQGPRGYRRMLVELGKQISRVERLLQAEGLAVATSLDFYGCHGRVLIGIRWCRDDAAGDHRDTVRKRPWRCRRLVCGLAARPGWESWLSRSAEAHRTAQGSRGGAFMGSEFQHETGSLEQEHA